MDDENEETPAEETPAEESESTPESDSGPTMQDVAQAVSALAGMVTALSAQVSALDVAVRTTGPAPEAPEEPDSISLDDLFE